MKLGEVTTVRFGLACNAVGLALVAVDAGWAPLTLALALLIVGQGLVAPRCPRSSPAAHPRADEGRRWACSKAAGGLARSVGPALGGFLFGRAVSSPYLVGAGLVVVAIFFVTDR